MNNLSPKQALDAASATEPTTAATPTKGAWSNDLQASLVVFLVALPLCMAIAEASGVSSLRGIVTGIVGGLIVGLIGGSPLQVSGPAAGLFVLVLQFVESIRRPFIQADLSAAFATSFTDCPDRAKFIASLATHEITLSQLNASLDQPLSVLPRGAELQLALGQAWDHSYALGTELALKYLSAVVLVAGLIQMFAAALHLGQWFRAISPAVVNGMLAGIGVLIFAKQFHVMLDDPSPGSPLWKLICIPSGIYEAIIDPDPTRRYAAFIGLTTLSVLVLWNRFRPVKLQIIPAALVAVFVAALLAALLHLKEGTGRHIAFIEVPKKLSSAITVIGLGNYAFSDFFHMLFEPRVWQAGFTIGLVASAESLLCATAVDKLHSGPRTRHDRELFAQGVGNAICGALGALPMTGVVVRSSANIEAGAHSKWSAVLHGLWLLVLVVVLPSILETIPTASLAAILVFTGFRLFWRPEVVRELSRFGSSRVVIYFTTIVAIVATDLLKGIAIGFALYSVQLLFTLSHLEVTIEAPKAEKTEDPDLSVIHLVGAATFLRLPVLAAALEALPLTGRYLLALKELDQIDHACLELLADWEKQVTKAGGTVSLEWDLLAQRFQRASLNRRTRTGLKSLKPAASGH